MSAKVRPLRHLLEWLTEGTRGGMTRARIIKVLYKTPQNTNQLANLLKMDYTTIRHHLEVLMKHRIITSTGDKYGTMYFLSPIIKENYGVFNEILNRIEKVK